MLDGLGATAAHLIDGGRYLTSEIAYTVNPEIITLLKVWYKLASMSEDRYPRRVFSQDWDAKPRRGRQRKVWSRLVDNLFGSLKQSG